MKKVMTKNLVVHLQALYGEIIDNPVATLLVLSNLKNEEIITTPQGLKDCQPNSEVKSFSLIKNDDTHSKYSYEIAITIYDSINFYKFEAASKCEIDE